MWKYQDPATLFIILDKEINWVFETNSDFLIHISLQPDGINLLYFKLRLFDLTDFIV